MLKSRLSRPSQVLKAFTDIPRNRDLTLIQIVRAPLPPATFGKGQGRGFRKADQGKFTSSFIHLRWPNTILI